MSTLQRDQNKKLPDTAAEDADPRRYDELMDQLLELPTGNDHSTDELRQTYTALYRSVLPGIFFRTQFQVE